MSQYRDDKKPIPNQYSTMKDTIDYSCYKCVNCSCNNPFKRSKFDTMMQQKYATPILNPQSNTQQKFKENRY